MKVFLYGESGAIKKDRAPLRLTRVGAAEDTRLLKWHFYFNTSDIICQAAAAYYVAEVMTPPPRHCVSS